MITQHHWKDAVGVELCCAFSESRLTQPQREKFCNGGSTEISLIMRQPLLVLLVVAQKTKIAFCLTNELTLT